MAAARANPWLAVDSVGDRVAQARALRRVHEAFRSGQDVAGRVRAVVAQSWARSGEAGVDPGPSLAPIVMDAREVDARWSRHPLHPVLPVLRDLLSDATSESGHMLVISDAEGVLLWMEGHQHVVEATSDMHFVVGADWGEGAAGTNALGTAIAVDHPVQIFSAEHFKEVVNPWQCSGAPIHDPATGEILGVVDLTGGLKTAHPHTLALVTAAAGMAEAYLRHDLARRDEAVRDAYLARIAGVAQPSVLVRPSGHVMLAAPGGWLSSDVVLARPRAGGEVVLPDGAVADVEPLGEAFVLWKRPVRSPAAAVVPVRLELLGRRPRVVLPSGEELELSARHAEILAVLALAGRGLTSEELTLEVYGEEGKPVTLRAEMSRLRRSLGAVLDTRPYGFTVPVTSDVADAERLLETGQLRAALAAADARVLPRSEAPLVVEARDRLEGGLRAAVLRELDPELLAAWCRSAAGRDDEVAARALLAALEPDDARIPAARARLARLRTVFG